ncbi:MAG: hypothetical protein IPJ43_10235 [Saprospiraceae bacterium]|nr:hypothetical protein [Saprospiraceae bacterium]
MGLFLNEAKQAYNTTDGALSMAFPYLLMEMIIQDLMVPRCIMYFKVKSGIKNSIK